MNSVQFSVLSTGETVERSYDSTGFQFRDKVISINADCPAIAAKRIADWKQYKLESFLNYRANRATPIVRNKKTLAAIDYLLGDKYRDKRTLQERNDDKEWARLCSSGTMAERLAYQDNAKRSLVNAILGDRETREAMQRWLASDTCSVDAKCERASYADMQREVMA